MLPPSPARGADSQDVPRASLPHASTRSRAARPQARHARTTARDASAEPRAAYGVDALRWRESAAERRWSHEVPTADDLKPRSQARFRSARGARQADADHWVTARGSAIAVGRAAQFRARPPSMRARAKPVRSAQLEEIRRPEFPAPGGCACSTFRRLAP